MLKLVLLVCIAFSTLGEVRIFFDQTVYDDDDDSEVMYRLPETLIPSLYQLNLLIDPESDSYTGNVNITFEVADANTTVNDVYLHVDTKFVSVESLVLNSGSECTMGAPNKADIVKITCPKDISGANNYLVIDFVTTFSTEDGFGMVKSTYLDQGKELILVESNFEPTFARRAFPCMDEPYLKANFSLTVICPEEYTVLSNTPTGISGQYKGLSVMTVFEVTPKISTYVTSLVISKFETIDNNSEDDDCEFKMFTRSEVANFTNTVTTYHNKILNSLSNFTGVSYENTSNTECYHVAIPDYLDSDGDFGIFTYRETDIIDEGDKTTVPVLQNIVKTIACKLSHQWYGGDISTKWWSDVWANEAVASYLQYVIADEVIENFDIMDQFVVEVVQKTMLYDALPNVEPLSNTNKSEVKLTWDIEKKLDTSSYLKGACFLHMVNYILGGEDDFKASLQYHWNQRAHSVTDGNTLLTDLAEHLDASEIPSDRYSYYERWVYAPGFPLIYARIKNAEDSNSQTEVVELLQKRFVYPAENVTYDNDTVWYVPISVTTEKDKDFNPFVNKMFIPKISLTYTIPYGFWIIINLQGRFLYRVNYEEELWRRIIRPLKNDSEMTDIHVLNRAQLVDDIFNIARIGDVNYSLAFELADYLVQETEYYPWYSAFNAFSYLLDHVDDADVKGNLQVVNSRSDDSNTSQIEVLKEIMNLDWRCKLGDLGCIVSMDIHFENYRRNQSSLENYNWRRVMFCSYMRVSDDLLNDWTFLFNVYMTTSSVHEKNDILHGLGCAANKNLIEWYLLKILTADSGIKKQDALIVFKSVFSSSFGLQAAMEFLEANLSNIATFFQRMDILSEMVYAVAEKLTTDDHIEWLRNVLSNEVLDGYDDIRSKAVVIASVNNYWAKNYMAELKAIFSSNPDSTTAAGNTTSSVTSTTSYTETTSITTPTVSSTEFSTEGTTVVSTTRSRSGWLSVPKFTIVFSTLVVLFMR